MADAAQNFGFVVSGLVVEDFRAVVDRAGFGVVGGEDELFDAVGGDGAGAHGAGFQGDRQRAVGQVFGAFCRRGLLQDQKFGVGGGVFQKLDFVAAGGPDIAGGIRDDGADRDFAARRGGGGLFEGEVHRVHAGFLPFGVWRV